MGVKVASALLLFSVVAAPALGSSEAGPKAKSLSPNDMRERRVGMQLRQLAADLNLSEEQKLQIKPLIEARMSEIRALRLDQNLDPQEKDSRLAAIQETYRSQMHGVLTPDQIQKLVALRESKRLAAQQTQTQKRKGKVPVDDQEQ